MVPVQRGLLAITLSFALFEHSRASEPIVNVIPENVSIAKHEFEEWVQQVNQALEEENLPVHWAKRGFLENTHIRQVAEVNEIEKGWRLLEKVVDLPDPPSAALFEIAKRCSYEWYEQWCEDNFIVERLIESDPQNLAVYFADFPYSFGTRGDDEILQFLGRESVRERFMLAAESLFVDGYVSRDAFDWATAARRIAKTKPPPMSAVAVLIEGYKEGIPENKLHGFHRPIEGVIWKRNYEARGFNIMSLPQLCGMMAKLDDVEGVEYCNRIAQVFKTDSYESGMAYQGFRIMQNVVSKSTSLTLPVYGNPDLEGLTEEWNGVVDFRSTERCTEPIWMSNGVIPNGGIDDLNLYYLDLQEHNYLEANNKAVKREWANVGLSGTPEEAECETYSIMHSYWPKRYPLEQQIN